jgi:hypothetical protein
MVVLGSMACYRDKKVKLSVSVLNYAMKAYEGTGWM